MNFIQSLLSEKGDVSHKRWISVTSSAALTFSIVWTVTKHPQYIPDTIHSTMIFISVMSGVATVAQVLTIWKGGSTSAQPADPNAQPAVV